MMESTKTAKDIALEKMLALKKHYDDLAKKELPYEENDIVVINSSEPWTGVYGAKLPIDLVKGTSLKVVNIRSTTDIDFSPLKTITAKIPTSVMRNFGINFDSIDIEPIEIIRVRGAQVRNCDVVINLSESNLRQIVREELTKNLK